MEEYEGDGDYDLATGQRDRAREVSGFQTRSFREGLEAGQETYAQVGFDSGYLYGGALGHAKGRLHGLVRAALAVAPPAAVTPAAAAAAREALACLDAIVIPPLLVAEAKVLTDARLAADEGHSESGSDSRTGEGGEDVLPLPPHVAAALQEAADKVTALLDTLGLQGIDVVAGLALPLPASA